MSRGRKPSLREGIGAALATTAAQADWRAPVVGNRDEVQAVPVADIAPNLHQPRRIFPERAMRELRESITQHGVLVPILVRPYPGPAGARYQIVAGERRWRACSELGLERIPAVVRDDIDDRSAIELALVENLQRRNIDPMEEAQALQTLLGLGYSQDELARRLGKSPAHVSERLRLTTLPGPIQALVLEGRLSSSAARNVARISDPTRQQEVALDLAAGHFTVRQVEAMMRQLRQPGADEAPAADSAVPLVAGRPPLAPVVSVPEPPLAQPGQVIDLQPLQERVAALLTEVGALPVGLDAATQTAVRATLQPLAGLLNAWKLTLPLNMSEADGLVRSTTGADQPAATGRRQS